MGGLDYYPSKFRHQEEKDEKEYQKQYYEANKEKKKQYYQDNKEKITEYRETNKEKLLEQQRQYHQTPAGKKSSRISDWKRYGIKLPEDYPDWDIFYEEEYMKTTKCEECGVVLTEGRTITSTTKCLDHCHITGEFRNILCHACNSKRRIY